MRATDTSATIDELTRNGNHKLSLTHDGSDLQIKAADPDIFCLTRIVIPFSMSCFEFRSCKMPILKLDIHILTVFAHRLQNPDSEDPESPRCFKPQSIDIILYVFFFCNTFSCGLPSSFLPTPSHQNVGSQLSHATPTKNSRPDNAFSVTQR
jgi:hypothetical protein